MHVKLLSRKSVASDKNGGLSAEGLAAALRERILRGDLRDGDSVPSVRALAGDLGAAAGTVQKAYITLAAEGLLRKRLTGGYVVNFDPNVARPEQLLAPLVQEFVDTTLERGFTKAQIVTALSAYLELNGDV